MFINTFRKGAGKEYFREQLYILLYLKQENDR